MTPGRNRYEAPDSLSKPIVESNDTPANSTQFTRSHSQSSSGIPNNLSGKLSISVCYLLPYLLTIMILSNMRKGLRNKMS